MSELQSRRKHLTKIVLLAAVIVGAVLFLEGPYSSQNAVTASASGPSASHTNAPGESNCTACHIGFPINGGDGDISITGVPASYLPGEAIPLTVRVNQASGVIFGFQMTAIDKDGNKIGTYTIPQGANPPLQEVAGIVEGRERNYVEHTFDGVTPGQFGWHSWTFTFNAPSRRMGKIRFYAAGNAADSDGGPGGDRIYATEAATLSGSAIASFDGDTKSDLSVFRPTNARWYSLSSSAGVYSEVEFGQPGDLIAPGDYDGDGKTDRVVWRPTNANWYFLPSTGGSYSFQFGLPNDIPVPADYDGDRKTDVAVWRPSTGTWYGIRSSDAGLMVQPFGLSGDQPVPADYDGDARAEIAVFRPSTAVWYMIRSADSSFYVSNFGLPDDQPVQSDYDGDGRCDLAVYRPTTSVFYALTASQTFIVTEFGIVGDKPAPADFDGDGKTDVTVYRNGTWYSLGTESPTFNIYNFGIAGDIPIARRIYSDRAMIVARHAGISDRVKPVKCSSHLTGFVSEEAELVNKALRLFRR